VSEYEIVKKEQVESALKYIRDSAQRAGQLAGAVKEADHRRKTHTAMAYTEATGTVAEREAIAMVSEEVQRAYKDICESVAAYETIKLNIKASETLIEVWRTENSNRRAGIL
jgi:hypothetical protein